MSKIPNNSINTKYLKQSQESYDVYSTSSVNTTVKPLINISSNFKRNVYDEDKENRGQTINT